MSRKQKQWVIIGVFSNGAGWSQKNYPQNATLTLSMEKIKEEKWLKHFNLYLLDGKYAMSSNLHLIHQKIASALFWWKPLKLAGIGQEMM